MTLLSIEFIGNDQARLHYAGGKQSLIPAAHVRLGAEPALSSEPELDWTAKYLVGSAWKNAEGTKAVINRVMTKEQRLLVYHTTLLVYHTTKNGTAHFEHDHLGRCIWAGRQYDLVAPWEEPAPVKLVDPIEPTPPRTAVPTVHLRVKQGRLQQLHNHPGDGRYRYWLDVQEVGKESVDVIPG